MTIDDLVARGRVLYGERWQSALAIDLGVTDRTVRRWVAREFSIPDDTEQKLQELMMERYNKIFSLLFYH